MPLIFDISCESCGYKSPDTIDHGKQVCIDGLNVTPRYPCEDQPRLAMLPHPGETQELERLGLTPDTATREGRMFAVDSYLCKACGREYNKRTMIVYSIPHQMFNWGCSLMLIGLFGGLILQIFWIIWAGLAIGMLLLFMHGWHERFIRRRLERRIRTQYADRARDLELPVLCPHCGSTDGVRPSDAGSPLRCPSCGQQTLKIEIAGIA